MGAASPLIAGALCRCPECGKGKLFSSYLRIAPRCPACGANFSIADAGDGPAVFVVLIVGAIVTPVLFILQFAFKLPGWASVTATMALAIALCLALLPPFKACLFALQWRNKAREVRNEDFSDVPR